MINNNSDLNKELRNTIKATNDLINPPVANVITPVININPDHNRIINIIVGEVRATTGAATVYTTPTNKDFYLTNITFHIVKDAACDMPTGAAEMYLKTASGDTQYIRIPVITLTAQSSSVELHFKRPVLLLRGSNISINNNSYAAGVCVRSSNLAGYTVDNINA